MASTARPAGREHFPAYPQNFVRLRILQFILSLVTFGLMAYSVSVGAFSGNCLMLFTALIATVITTWEVVAHIWAPKAYNYWAVLALDIFLTIFWLISFAVLAAQTATLFETYDGRGGYRNITLNKPALAWVSILATAAALGGVSFLIWVVGLITHSIVVHRHRRSGLHSKPLRGARDAEEGAKTANAQQVDHVYMPAPQTQYSKHELYVPEQEQYQGRHQLPADYNQQPMYGSPHAQEYRPQHELAVPVHEQHQEQHQQYQTPQMLASDSPRHMVSQPTSTSPAAPASPRAQRVYEAPGHPYQPPPQELH